MQIDLDASARRRGLLLIALAAVLWGTVGVASKAVFALADTNSLSVGFFRLAISAPGLLLAGWWLLGRKLFAVRRRDLWLMLLIGAMMALYQVCYFAAIQRVGVAIAVLITLCTAPVIVALLSVAVFREPLTRVTLLAILCALLGTGLLVGVRSDELGGSPEVVAGVLLALGSAFGYAMVALCGRGLAGAYHPLQPIAVGFAAGALSLLPFALATGLVVAYPTAGWALLVYLGLVPTAFAYVLFLAGMRHTTATFASVITLLEPLTSTLLAWLLFGERLGPLGLLGVALLLGAIGLLYHVPPRRT